MTTPSPAAEHGNEIESVASRRHKTYEGDLVRLVDLLAPPTRPVLEGLTFNRCRITGPAVVHLNARVYLAGCQFEVPVAEAMLLELPVGVALVGVIEIRDASFRRCLFEGVGFAGIATELAAFRDMLHPV